MLNSDEAFYLDRFAFAAITINKWIKHFGRETAEQMIKSATYDDDHFNEYTKEAFAASFENY